MLSGLFRSGVGGRAEQPQSFPGCWGFPRGLGLVPKPCGTALALGRHGEACKKAAPHPRLSEHPLVTEQNTHAERFALVCSGCAAASFTFVFSASLLLC